MIIYDKNNHPVITKQNLLAKNAAGTEQLCSQAAQIYHMQVQITALLKPGQTPDFTRNGVATGYVVVPEFPASNTNTTASNPTTTTISSPTTHSWVVPFIVFVIVVIIIAANSTEIKA